MHTRPPNNIKTRTVAQHPASEFTQSQKQNITYASLDNRVVSKPSSSPVADP